jgi:hypothetical protein
VSKTSNTGEIIYKILHAVLIFTFSLALTTLVYFLILISPKYKSFPLITQKIEQAINKNSAEDFKVKINKSSLKFDNFSKLKIRFDDIRLLNDMAPEIVLPQVEVEFSIFSLLLLKTIPDGVKIIGPQIKINDMGNGPEVVLNGIDGENFLPDKTPFKKLSKIFSSLKSGAITIKNFVIIDAKIDFTNQLGNQIIHLKESQIKTFFEGGYFHLILRNKISLNPEPKNDLLLSANCKFKKSQGLNCGIDFRNFYPPSITFLNSKLSILQTIQGFVSGQTKFTTNPNYQLTKASFSASSEKNQFHFPTLFSDKIALQNLQLSGQFDNEKKTLSIDKLNCNFDDTNFAMHYEAKNFGDDDKQIVTMEFKINDAPTSKLDLLWPIFLKGKDIRKWVINHIDGGMIDDAYAKMTLIRKGGIDELGMIDSEVEFSKINMEYDKNFPPISKMDGVAYFHKKGMKIDITKGEVLESRIDDAVIEIENFQSYPAILKISGDIEGKAEDSLKHIGYKTEFVKEIGNYFNGKARTSVQINLPIIPELALEDVEIEVSSSVGSFNNDYINNSHILISTKKNVGSIDFKTSINLDNAQINIPKFNIFKKRGFPGKINTVLSFDAKERLNLKKFSWIQGNEKISGDLSLNIDPIAIRQINLQNRGFGKSNFDLDYRVFNNNRFVRISGKSIYLKNILEDNIDDVKGSKNYTNNDIEIVLDEITLANDQIFKDIDVDIKCDGANCEAGSIQAKLSDEHKVDIVISKTKTNKPSYIVGQISDISLIDRAFNISNKILDGDVRLKAKITDDKISGKFKIDSGFTVLRNKVVDEISDNEVFSKLKDSIKKSNKIFFDSLEIEFYLENNIFDIKTLIASSTVLGITAKGEIDLNDESINLKGLIIPGYALNKLFNVGKIPVLGKILVGEKGGGIFAVRYDYLKNPQNDDGEFSINPASAFIPGGIRNILDLF